MTKSEQARINGAKSKGPVTPEGKKTSSRNSLKHGFAATQNVVISLEDEPEWNLHRDFQNFQTPKPLPINLLPHFASQNIGTGPA
jgi:hypothetical protein